MSFKQWFIVVSVIACSAPAAIAGAGQETAPQESTEPQVSTSSPNRWMVMNDGVLFATFDRQGSDRGETQFRSQNWFMTMAQHKFGPGDLTLKGMFSAEPFTVGTRGYSELFQMGEAYSPTGQTCVPPSVLRTDCVENTDHQHPHDLFMQLAAVWRVSLGGSTGLAFSGGPVGEATLGPVAFMHRQSASENPTAPVAHHTLDSTHIAEGVLAVSVDHGPWVVEASAFHGREPDQFRYNVETGALDSWAGRVWFKPSPSWLAQVSYGFIKAPEQLEPGNERRTTASLSWTETVGSDYIAVTGAVGRNQRIFDTNTIAFLGEATLHHGRNSVYARAEELQVTSEHLLFPTIVHTPHPGELIDWLGAFTAGAVRNLSTQGPLEIGIGADATVYQIPDRLVSSSQVTGLYGSHPVSVHVFVRIRPRAPAMGHMWNTSMPNPAMR
jgi:hypothetical protein